MILIFDDNEYRLHDNVKVFRFADIPVKGASYEDCEYYTKPMVVILVAPKPSEIQRYMREFSGPSTVCVLLLRKDITEAKFSRNVIIDSNLKITPSQVMEIIKKEFGYNMYSDMINHILVDEEDKDVYFGGKRLWLEKREYKIARFFVYNQNKIFTIDDVHDYLHMRIKLRTLNDYISRINGKCEDAYREKLIIRHPFGFGITKVTGIVPHAKLKKSELKKFRRQA